MELRTCFKIFLCCIFLGSCGEGPCLKGTGSSVTEVRSVGTYYGLYLKDGIHYRLSTDSSTELILEGGKNILPYIKAEVKAGILEIKNDNSCNFLRNNKKNVTITIPAAHLRYINYQGFGNLKTLLPWQGDSLELQVREGGDIELAVNTKKLFIQHAGFGDVSLSGNTGFFECYYREFCKVEASSLVTDTLFVKSESAAEGSFHATKEATIRIWGSGNVVLQGEANTTVERLGKGNFIR